MFAVPGTPSDWRSPENTRRDIRRILRERRGGELFARQARPGRHAWRNETAKFVEVVLHFYSRKADPKMLRFYHTCYCLISRT